MNRTTHPIEREEVMAWLDGELDAARAATVEAHVGECGECRALADELRAVSARMAEWQVEPAPAPLTTRVEAAAREAASHASKPRKWFLPTWAWQLAAALGVLIIVVALFTPNLLRSRMAANEASAVGSLRTLNTACVTYSSRYGSFPLYLRQLGPGDPPSKDAADLVDAVLASGAKSGYRFSYNPGTLDPRGDVLDFTITASPLVVGESGQRRFFTDESGVIRANPNSPADSNSTPISGGEPDQRGSLRAAASDPALSGPMIARSASLTLVTKEFEEVRSAMEETVRKHGGHVAQLTAGGRSGGPRSLSAALRIPYDKFEAAIRELRKLGRVENESQAGEEVTKQHTDLVARQSNARHIEQRLVGIMQKHTGKVKEVLEVEKEIARVREEIEQMEGERKTLENRVSFATIQVRILEEYEAQVDAPQSSAGLRVRNAAVEGFQSLRESALGLALFLLSYGPPLLFWGALLFWPARYAWRRLRAAAAQA